MSEWPRQPLVELATVTMGQSPDAAAVNDAEAGLPFLQGCAEFGERIPTPRLHCSPPLRVAKAGSTLISVRAPVGTTNRADQDYCIGRGLGAVLAKSGVADDVFLLHAIEANLEFLHRRSQGSTFLAISSKDLYSLPVPAPGLPTQRRIAEILSTLDEAIEQTEALIAKMQQVKAGLMHDFFTRGVTPDGRLRPTREQAPELYKESPLGWIPKEWEVTPLVSFSSSRPGSFVNGPFGSDLLTSELQSSGVPVIYVQDLKEDEYRRVSNAHVTEKKANKLLVCNVRFGDVLVAKVGDPPGIAAAYLVNQRGVVTQDVIRIRPSDDVVTQFLASLLNSTVGSRAIRRITIEGTRARVSLTEFKKLLLPKPTPEEQQLVAERLSAIQQIFTTLSDNLCKLKTKKSGLMHDLLTGRVQMDLSHTLVG